MESIFEDELGKSLFIYLDDILLPIETLEEHFQVLEKVLSKLREYNLRLKPKKCAFLKTETAFLGHVTGEDGFKTDAEKVEKIRAFPVPKNPTDMRFFLGLCNYYRQFVKNFTLKSKPLRDVMVDGKWHWAGKEQHVFDDTKDCMSSTPVLAQPDTEAVISGEKPFILYTDASKDGVGAVLQQRIYAITDLDALASISALDKFKYFLLATHVTARTDHQPLVSLFKRRDLSGRAHRWALEIQEWNQLKIEYIPGTKNVVADALSRNVEPERADNTLDTQIKAVVMNVSSDGWTLNELNDDEWLKQVFARPEAVWADALREKDMVLEGNRLSRLLHNGRKVFVVPQSRTRAVFDQFHSGTFGGHSDFHKTIRMMEKYVYWPKTGRDVRRWVRKCFTCAHINRQRKTVPPLKRILSQHPYELVGIDVSSLGQTSSDHQYVVTVIDHHLMFCAAYPVADKTAKAIAKVFWENWCLRECRMPESLLSDRGGEFLNEITEEIRALTGIDQKFTVGHNPRDNGVYDV
ncbi:gagpol and env protein precursor [Aphelenchoides avenae]|nr:gagpol and env protein precursor [Aphelenchus avenae]